MSALLKKAIAEAKAGDPVLARQLLMQSLQADPRNEAAWLWLAYVLDDSTRRRQALETALFINPKSKQARAGLAQLEQASKQDTGPLSKSEPSSPRASIAEAAATKDTTWVDEFMEQHEEREKERQEEAELTRNLARLSLLAKDEVASQSQDEKESQKETEVSRYRARLRRLKNEEAKSQKERAENLKNKLADLRQKIREEPPSAELHYLLAAHLLSTVPQFANLQAGGPKFWERFRSADRIEGPLPRNRYSEVSEAKEHLNLALGLGLSDPLIKAKAHFLLYLLLSDHSTFLDKHDHRRRTLAKNVITETKKHLRRQPHDLEALLLQHAVYYWLSDKRGLGKTEQAIEQARALTKAGLSSEGSSLEKYQESFSARGQELEEKVSALFQAMGLTAAVTKSTADGGIDIEAYSSDPIYAGKYLVQCKDWSNPVGESVVRDLYGVVMAENANKGILVTTGRFTAAAESFAQNKQLELIDGSTLRALLQKYGFGR